MSSWVMSRKRNSTTNSPVADFVGEAADSGADFRAGASVALWLRAHGVNANQVFKVASCAETG